MTIEFRTSGGVAYFPGLSAPVTFDTANLPAERRTSLERLVEEAHFFDQPADAPLPQRGADYQVHTITIKDGPRSHTVTYRRSDQGRIARCSGRGAAEATQREESGAAVRR